MTVHMKKPLAVVAHDASAAAHPGSARSTTNAATAPTTTPRNPSAVAGNRNRTGIPAHAGANRGNGADGHGAIASTATVANKTGKTMMTVSQLAMLTVVAVASLRSLPAMADYGLASILLYLIPAVVFLVPTALVAAELATGWKGGVYVWVREAFGNRIGFLAIWLQWIQNVVWYPIQIAFIAVSLSYVFGMGGLGNNGVYVAAVIIVLYWASTMVALRGGNLFAKVGSISGLIGTLFPALLLIVFGIIWLAIGKPVQTSLHASALLPPWTGIASIVLIVSNVLAYAGMEVNAVHANDLEHPGRQFPRAIALATALILLVLVLPTLAIAFAVPHRELGLIDGINLAFREFFDHFGMGWGTPVISLLIALGAGGLDSWSFSRFASGRPHGTDASRAAEAQCPRRAGRHSDSARHYRDRAGVAVRVDPQWQHGFRDAGGYGDRAVSGDVHVDVCRRDSSAQHPSRSPPHVSSSCDSVGRGRRFRRFRRGIRVDFRETGWFHRFG